MTDRELLELAAKAAGVPKPFQLLRDGTWVFDEPHRKNWNPLTDDGDALRLAVKLHIEVASDSFDAIARFVPAGQHPMAEGFCEIYEDARADPYAATRRAIVCAAAEIGRTQ
jgi:hypothetical protein